MPKCPSCGEEIEYLRDFTKVEQEFRLYIDENGGDQLEDMNNLVPCDDEEDEYECPECAIVIFRDCLEAVAFLKGESSA